MSQIILSALVNAVVSGKTIEETALSEYLTLHKAKAAKAKAVDEFKAALTTAKASGAAKRKPRRVKAIQAAPKVQGVVTVPSSEKLALVHYRGQFKAFCANLIRTNGKPASAGSDTAFNEAAASLGQSGTIGARMAVLLFLHHMRTGQTMSKLDLSRLGIVVNHLHYQKVSGFLATLKSS